MALKLITSEEAARVLGLPLEELNRLREVREISGYRDGSNWKFKEQDVLRLKERLAEPASDDASSDFDLSFSVDADESIDSEEFDFGTTASSPEASATHDSQELADSQDLIDLPVEEDNLTDEVVLLSDLELGESGPGTSSTIIGRPGVHSPEESDIRIVTDEDSAEVSDNPSDLALPSDSESSVALVVDDQFDVSPEADTQVRLNPQPTGSSGLDLTGDAPLASSSDVSLGDDSFGMDDLVLGADPSGSSGSGSRGSKTGESGVALAVEDLDDDDLVLGGGSDITLGSADSGISLASPSDSGLSLEEPLALRPAKEAKVKVEDDAMSLGLDADSEAGSDDDFLLTPMQDADEQDSGSQVIALDSESSMGADMFGEDAGMGELGEDMFQEAGDEGMLAGDFGAATESADPLAGAAPAAGLAAGPTVVSREAPYTVWNVVSLSACALILALCGLMMFDLVRNMWSWDTPYSLNSSLAETILGIIPGMQ